MTIHGLMRLRKSERAEIVAALTAVSNGPLPPDVTIHLAAKRCEQFGLVEFFTNANGRAQYRLTPKGETWLAAVGAFARVA